MLVSNIQLSNSFESEDGLLMLFALSRKDQEINSLNSKLEDEQSLVAQLQKKIKELQVSA